jgi:phosphatidylglycerophosphate synthase
LILALKQPPGSVRDRIEIAAKAKLNSRNGLVTPSDGQSALAQGLAFKAFEIEELADVFFFRPAGAMIARSARFLGMTPLQLTVTGTLAGIVGGALLYGERLGWFAFSLLILHGIIDSADGQLARMTGQVSELGRVLDGVSGHVTHGAIYLAIAAGFMQRGGSSSILVWMLLAGVSNAMQAQMYEYHRTAYLTVALEGRVPENDPSKVPSWVRWLFLGYLMAQRRLIGLHGQVEAVIKARSVAGRVGDGDRARYRECFYWPVRGWNLLGDNTRFYAIGVLLWVHRIDLFFAFILVPMNLALIVLWFWQRKADRRFLASL